MKEFNQNYSDIQFIPIHERNKIMDRRNSEIEKYNEEVRKINNRAKR